MTRAEIEALLRELAATRQYLEETGRLLAAMVQHLRENEARLHARRGDDLA